MTFSTYFFIFDKLCVKSTGTQNLNKICTKISDTPQMRYHKMKPRFMHNAWLPYPQKLRPMSKLLIVGAIIIQGKTWGEGYFSR